MNRLQRGTTATLQPVERRTERSVGAILCAVAAWAPLIAPAGCGTAPEDLRFPPGFLFGSAVAGFQVEMGCPTVAAEECEDRASDWYEYITTPELVNDPTLFIAGDPPSSGPGFFELYPQDLDRARGELENNALRLSIEWSRVFPTSTVGLDDPQALAKAANPKALAYYHALFAAMKARGIKPLVTLNHYSLPAWIHGATACHKDIATCPARGWVDRETIVREIARYAGFVAREFGGDVDLWATLNEPFTAVVLAGFLFQTSTRTNPPGVNLKIDEAKTAMVAMIEAHARMYDAVRAADLVDADGDGRAARVGLVFNLQAVRPVSDTDPLDAAGVENLDYLMNRSFLNATIRGDLDEKLDGSAVHRDDLAGRMDYLGINYYARLTVQGTPTSFLPRISSRLTFNPIALEYDYDYPRGVFEVLTLANEYGIPLMITETGRDVVDDEEPAAAWVVRTLTWLKRAINSGVPVEGYFYWTLIDNYEWNHGMSIRMGLYGVDKNDAMKTRRPRAAVSTYARIAGPAEVPADLLRKYPVDE